MRLINIDFLFFSSDSNKKCLECDVKTHEVYVTSCNFERLTQKWDWGFKNETNLRNWLTYGAKIVDKNEIEMLKGLL